MCYDPLRFILCFVVCHPLLISFDSSHLSLSLSLSLLLRLFNLFPFLFLALFFLLGSSPTLFFQKKNVLFCFLFFSCSSPHVPCLRREREMEREEGKGERQLLSFFFHPVAFPCLSLFLFSPLWGLPFPFRTFPPLLSWAFFSLPLSFFSLGLSLSFRVFPFLLFQAFPTLFPFPLGLSLAFSVSIFGLSLSGFPLSFWAFPPPFSFFSLASPPPFRFSLSLSGFSCPLSFRSFPFSFRRSLFLSGLPFSFRDFPFGLCFVLSVFPFPFRTFLPLFSSSFGLSFPLLGFPSPFSFGLAFSLIFLVFPFLSLLGFLVSFRAFPFPFGLSFPSPSFSGFHASWPFSLRAFHPFPFLAFPPLFSFPFGLYIPLCFPSPFRFRAFL